MPSSDPMPDIRDPEAPPSGRSAPSLDSLERTVSLLRATLDSTADGILAVDGSGRIRQYNRRFAKMWGLPPELLDRRDDEAALARAVEQVEDPEAFLRRVRELYAHSEERSFDTVRLKDGRVFERYSRPEWLDGRVVGRVWSFRDVTDRTRAEEALRESETRYRKLFEDSGHAIYLTNVDGTFVDANAAALRLFGVDRATLLASNAADFYQDPDGRAAFQQAIHASGDVLERYPLRLRAGDGRVMECLLSATVRRDAAGGVSGYQGIMEDVTDRRAAERALAERERLFRSLIEHASDTITVTRADGVITYESPSLHRVLGYHPQELVGRRIFDLIRDRDRARALAQMEVLIHRPDQTGRLEVEFLHKDGTWRTMEAVARNLLDDPSVAGIVINARDITDRKRAEAQLLHDAFHDRLTQLPNRALFLDRLNHKLQAGQRGEAAPFAVLFLDLDRFKVVNDSLGHSVGDRLLVAMARRLRSVTRPGDTVARLGGDEFTVLVDGADLDEARRVAERIHEALEAPFDMAGRPVYTSASIGIASSQTPYRVAEDMLRDADLAMYQAKDRGRARHETFDEELHLAALTRLQIETDLRHALEREEFEVFYQPIVRLSDGGLLGFEALLRWWHPSRGLLLPAAFLPLAEETGLIVPVGNWVLREVCAQMVRWREALGEAARVPVRVNVSALQLARPDFVDHVASALEACGAPAPLLHLELTESAMMEQAETSVVILERLKALGVGLTIDDFGTGYSSLAYLHRFPTDTVKIDRSFVSSLTDAASELGIIRTILDLARDLGMGVVAEGIETEAQATALRDAGCVAGQGFLYARPLPAAEAAGLMARPG